MDKRHASPRDAAPPAGPRRALLVLCLPLGALLMAATEYAPQPSHETAHRLAEARVAASSGLRTLENATAAAAREADALDRRRTDARDRLQVRTSALAAVLPLIERLSLYPAETLLAVHADPEAALTGLLVLKGVARQIEVDAEALQAEQAEIDRLTAALAAAETKLTAAQSAQAAQSANLDRQFAEARGHGHESDDAASALTRRAASQVSQADTVRAALAQLDQARRQDEARARADAAVAERQRQDAMAAEARRRQAALAQPAGPGIAGLRGKLEAPVAGSVLHAFGDAGDAGAATGISYSSPPAARVSTPCAGRVVFAGPFRSFRQLVIIDCGGGYHFVLAGLDRLDVPAGRPVQAGEPVGVMPGWDPHGAAPRPSLYVELRANGDPINPAPFLRSHS